ncbi:hypothetical protein C7N43_23420 [Sphingobacteriales bacterium UPWRP_1]|nr:hypothetical protein B6N25_15550 [Sphingobacteriales bacterium TSM_CSS]PSJ74532.1 hypothetical protein C7N43_23420 [Sphingobacteriales bacterium UPWRP_1]
MSGNSGFVKYFFFRFGKLLLFMASVALIALILQKCDFSSMLPSGAPSTSPQTPKSPVEQPETTNPEYPVKGDEVNQKLQSKKLIYTKHARCRMGCRNISEEEVVYVLKNGKVNMVKSDMDNAPCPKYAIEGETAGKERVRIVFADCPDATKVVTTIDLNNDDDSNCHCN